MKLRGHAKCPDVPASGALTFEVVAPDVTLRSGPTSGFDTDGWTIVIHQTVDDDTSVRAGNAEDRVEYGAITREFTSASGPFGRSV